MKELWKGITALIGSLIISAIAIPVGTVYSFLYAIWLSVTLKDPKAFFRFMWKMIDGTATSIGHFLYFGVAFSLDMLWNVHGEVIEDVVTSEEDTAFNQKNMTVSASIGELEINDKLNNKGKMFSKVLNYAFNQKQHAKDAYHYTKARKELKAKYFEKRD